MRRAGQARKVGSNGEIKWKGRTTFVSSALEGEPVGLRGIGERNWMVKYGTIVLGTIVLGTIVLGTIVLGTIKGENKKHRIMPIKQQRTKKPAAKSKKP
jgi:hypothetical protein